MILGDGMRSGEGKIILCMKCLCGYTYKIEIIYTPDWEICPICGHSAPLADFCLEAQYDKPRCKVSNY